jgi:serine O-acetyltransferase
MSMPETEMNMVPRDADDMPTVSATAPDWSRERPRRFWDPSRKLIRALRRYQAARARSGPINRLLSRYWVLSHRFWTVVAQAEVPLNVEIGGGLLMTHPNGVVIHPKARIGPNCLIMQQVTIGQNRGKHQNLPVIGGHVDIGPGAKVLGGITIGDHAQIGANAVVLQDVPPWAVVVGIPARVIGDRRPAEPGAQARSGPPQ